MALSRAVARLLPLFPRPFVARVARRYVAGTRSEDVLELVRELQERGMTATIDILGENVDAAEEAEEATDAYLHVLDELRARGLPGHVSVKLTHLGLRIEETLATHHLERIVRRAAETGSFVRIDMEDSTTTDAAIRIFRALREGHERIGLAIQAYLRRSRDDVESLLPLRPNLRICKGIYDEPAQIAFQDRQRIRESFDGLVRQVLEGGGYAAIATHDPWLVERGLSLVREVGRDRHEFQMLLGVGHELRPRILSSGSLLRIYCPFGPRWYEYSLRRLQENPKIVSYVIRDLLKRGREKEPHGSERRS